MNDDQLHRLLSRHPAQIRLPESFCRSVWARIAAAESAARNRRAGGAFLTWLARPLPAALLVALVLALGWALCSWLYQMGQAADEKSDIRSISRVRQVEGEKVW